MSNSFRYVFEKDHPFTFKMLKGGLTTLLGEYPVRHDKDSSIIFAWAELLLEYYVDSSLAGRSLITLKERDSRLEEVIKSWHKHGKSTVPADHPQIQYVNIKDKLSNDEAWVQFSFPPNASFNFGAIKAGVYMVLEKRATAESEIKGANGRIFNHHASWCDKNGVIIATLSEATNYDGSVLKSIYLRIHPKYDQLIALATAWIQRGQFIEQPQSGRVASK